MVGKFTMTDVDDPQDYGIILEKAGAKVKQYKIFWFQLNSWGWYDKIDALAFTGWFEDWANNK
jgi:hypothetical protein